MGDEWTVSERVWWWPCSNRHFQLVWFLRPTRLGITEQQ